MTTTIIQPKPQHRSGCAHFPSDINGGAQPLLPPARPRARGRKHIGVSHEYFRAMHEAEQAVWQAVRARRIRLARAALNDRVLSSQNSTHHQNNNRLNP